MYPDGRDFTAFKYDLFGRRIYKSSSTATSIFAYDSDNLIEETSNGGAAVARYVQGLKIDQPLAMLRGGATSYYDADAPGSITSFSDASGALAQTYAFDSFGVQTGSSGSLTNPFRYTAREFDSETSLYFYRARYYDQSLGRLVGEDPERFDGSINFYSYVDNNPIIWLDPLGLDKVEVCCRPLYKFQINLKLFHIRPLGLWHHCYIQITGPNGGSKTWGVLPGLGGQQPRDYGENSGGKYKEVPCTSCKLDDLRKRLDNSVWPWGTCPSCGPYNYHNNIFKMNFYNSNTYVYNMINNTCGNSPKEPRSPGYYPAADYQQ